MPVYAWGVEFNSEAGQMEQIANAAVSQGGFMTTLAGKLSGGEAFAVIVLVLAAAIAGGFAWLAMNTKKRKESRDFEQEAQNREIAEGKSKIREIEGEFKNYVSKTEFNEVKSDMKELKKEVHKIQIEAFTRQDGKEIFSKLDRLLERDRRQL